MATEIESQVKSWGKAEETVTLRAGEFYDDVTTKLREVEAMYLEKADELEKKAVGDLKEGVMQGVLFYRRAAEAVRALINQPEK
jgi:hypothetical protein